MSSIGFIGAGSISSTIGRLAVDAGYDVVPSDRRGWDTLADLVDESGTTARAATTAEAAQAGDIVVVSIPMLVHRSVPAEHLRGKVVIDTNDHFAQHDDRIPELDDGSTTSSELLQAHAPDAPSSRSSPTSMPGTSGTSPDPQAPSTVR
jgi:predicted dinucleotide-binding enzyme